MTRNRSNQDRHKQLSTMLADLPHPARSVAPSTFRADRVRWLLDLADVIDALGLGDTDELATSARTAAFGLVREAMDQTANPAKPVL